MKQVLIVDTPPIFREFLKNKFSEEKIDVTFIQEKRDAITKMISLFPDLVIMDISEFENIEDVKEILQKIKSDPNASRIPLLVTGPVLDRMNLALFAKYGVHKYFVKPIKFDIFFESIGQILKTAFSMDTTPCILDLHRNGNIIFIEIAQGLNREKLTLLKYKLSEIIENEGLENPNVVLMMSNLDLTFVDGLNLEFLFDNILENPKIQAKNVKVLSLSSFVKELVDGHPQYDGIEVVTNISQVLNTLVDSTTTSRISDLITDNILTTTGSDSDSSIEMRFYQDSSIKPIQKEEKTVETQTETVQNNEESQNSENKLRVAIIDADQITQKLVAAAFIIAGWEADTYSNGMDFLSAINQHKYSIIIIDLLIPGLSGLDTLKRLQGLKNKPPIIIYSQAMKKEFVMQAFSLGAKQYLVKPQIPESIVTKAQELLNAQI